jgi:ABC-type antimicrobial peptide transport system permease subunit
VRLALGASRARLFQQSLVDGPLLALCGLAVALPLGWWSSQVLTAMLSFVVRDGLIVVVPGVLIGVPCALAAATLVRSQLYGLAPNDPATIIGAAAVFTMTGFVAALLPALRASKIDPMDALRQE